MDPPNSLALVREFNAPMRLPYAARKMTSFCKYWMCMVN
jgi:hypothetical protein